jgi:hypothetical protein
MVDLNWCGGTMTKRQRLEREIHHLIQIIGSNMAALRLASISSADKKHLLLAVGQRRVRLALLQEQLAMLPN